MLRGRHRPPFVSSHHRLVFCQHLIWRPETQTTLDVAVGFLLINGELFAAILQAEHSQAVVEALLTDAVLAFHFAIVTGRGYPDAMIAYPVFFQFQFKQCLIRWIIGYSFWQMCFSSELFSPAL